MHRLLIILLLAMALVGCANQGSAPDAIEKYLKARVSGDEEKLAGLSCKAWEAQASADAASFQSVEARIDGLECKEAGKDSSVTLVTCSGTLVIQYRGEEPREQGLGDVTYRAVKEDGEWKMCGEQ